MMMFNRNGLLLLYDGIKILGIQSRSELNISLVKMNNESRIEQNNQMNIEQKSYKRRIINQTIITIMYDNNWHKSLFTT